MLNTLLLILAVICVAALAVAAWFYLQLAPWRSLRLRRVKGLVVERDTVPANDREPLDLAAAELEALGFKRIYTMATKPQYAAKPARPAYWDVYEHPSVHAQAHVGLRARYLPTFMAQRWEGSQSNGPFSDQQPYFAWFVTSFTDQSNIMSVNQFMQHIGVITPEWAVYDDYHATLAANWHMHQQLTGSTGRAIEVNSVEIFKRMQWLMHAKIDYMVSAGFAEPVPGKKRWRYTWKGVWHMWRENRLGETASKRGTEIARKLADSQSPVGYDRRKNANLLDLGGLRRRKSDRPSIPPVEMDDDSELPVIATSKGERKLRGGVKA
jgi:hypothetical protein